MNMSYQHTKLACYIGCITQAVVNNFAPLLFALFQEQFSISLGAIGQLVLLNFGVQLLTDLLAAKFVDVIGVRRCIVAAHFLCAAGILGLGILPKLLSSPYLGLVISVVLYAVGGGLIEVIISPIIDSLPSEAKASSMSFLHSFYCWGQMLVIIVTTVLLRLLGAEIWYVLSVAWAILPLINGVVFCFVPLLPITDGENRCTLGSLFSQRIFIVALLLMMCAGAAELTIAQWSSFFAEVGLGVDKTVGDLLAPCMFACLMGIGRLLYGIFGSKIPIRKALICCASLTVICYLMITLSPHPIVSMIGVALCGLGVSLMWPGVLSYAGTNISGGAMMFALLALAGDTGCSLAPWIAGMVSDATGSIRQGILWVIGFPVLMLMLLCFSPLKKTHKSHTDALD